MARRRRTFAIAAAIAGLVLAVSACGSDDDGAEPASDETTPGSTPSSSPTSTSQTPTKQTPTKQTPTEPTRSAPSTSAPSPTGSPTETPTEEPMPETGPVAEAIADLADRTGSSPDDIQVIAHDQVTWRDGSLGCPEPGKMYTQALVDGYRIVLRVHGQDVHYHGSAGGSPFRCDHPDPNGAVDQRS